MLRSSLTLLIDRVDLEIVENQNVDNISDMVQLMLRIGVKLLGILKKITAFPFHLEDLSSKKMTNHSDKVVVQYYGIRINFIARTKIGGSPLMTVLLRHGMGRVRAAKLATNMPLLLAFNTYTRQLAFTWEAAR